MLRVISEIKGYPLRATDDTVGKCKDFLFDDDHWTVRYMVADTGRWLPGRKVLISPMSCRKPDWENREFPLNLSKEQVEKAPPLEVDAPVSRQYEMKYLAYYDWPYYWVGNKAWGLEVMPAAIRSSEGKQDEERKKEGTVSTLEREPHLRSVDEVTGYHIEAQDGEIGHVEDFIMDDETWTVRYIVVDTRNLLPGKKVLVSPTWIDRISWADRKVRVGLNRETIKDSPEFDPNEPVNREYESRLYDYYGRPHYWQKR